MIGAALLVAEQVGVRLGQVAVIGEVSFGLDAGKLVALVGPNGAGKTTLLRALAGLIPATGTVRIAGDAVARLKPGARARRIAYLPQGHDVHWPLPARDIVALGRFPHGARDPGRLAPPDADAVDRAIVATGIAPLADRIATALSGGERARVALARMLAVEAPVMLCDEPTASLDPFYQIAIMGVLRRAAEAGGLVVVVMHDLGLAARFADRVLVLEAGRLAAAGPPREALSDRVLAEVFRVQAHRAQVGAEPALVPWAVL